MKHDLKQLVLSGMLLMCPSVLHANSCENMEDDLLDLMENILVVAEYHDPGGHCDLTIKSTLSTMELGIEIAAAKRKYPDGYFSSCRNCYYIGGNLRKAKEYCPTKIRGSIRRVDRIWNRYEDRCEG